MPSAPRARSRRLPRHAQRLLEDGARLLGAGLEILRPDRPPARSRWEPRVCRECRTENPGLSFDCSRRRRAQSRLVEPGPGPVAWECPRGARLAVWPVRVGAPHQAALVSRQPPRRGASFEPRPRPLGVAAASAERARSTRGSAPLRSLARQLGEAIRLGRRLHDLRSELEAKHEELRAFYAMAGQLSASPDLAPALREVMESARAAQDADVVLLWTNGRRRRELLLRTGLESFETGARRFWNALGPALHARINSNGRQPLSGLLTGGEADLPASLPPLRFLAAPLHHDGTGDGVLCLGRFEPARPFQPTDGLLLASLAEQIRLALSNAERDEDLQVFLMATVKSLVGAIEEKDPYTSGHSERVHLVSMLIGRQLSLSSAEMETLRWASILHDVGKIGLPESILLKPGRLTAEEFARVREHPDRGYRLLRPIRQLAAAAECIRAHHEQIDGSGYPRGLRGESIPRLARIVAVADTYDALTSTRAYRTARTLDATFAEIRRVRGTQLDAEAVDALLRLEPFLREHQVMIEASRAEDRRRAA